jgi:hypothetical protein
MTEAIGKLCELYGGGETAKLPNGTLELKDFSQIKGPSLEERIESFFPVLPAALKETLIHELS